MDLIDIQLSLAYYKCKTTVLHFKLFNVVYKNLIVRARYLNLLLDTYQTKQTNLIVSKTNQSTWLYYVARFKRVLTSLNEDRDTIELVSLLFFFAFPSSEGGGDCSLPLSSSA